VKGQRPFWGLGQSPKLSPGARVALFFAAMFATFAIQGSYLPLWFSDRGLSAGSIGTVLGVASLFRVICGPAWGALADRLGQRGVVLFCTALAATCGALMYVPLHGFVPILLVAAGQGMVSSALSPLIDALALGLAREGRMQYGPVRAWGSAAFMVATSAGGWLVGAVGSWLVPWLLAGGYATAALSARLLAEPAAQPGGSGGSRNPLAGLSLFRLPAFRLTVASSALIQGAHAAFYGFGPLFWRSQGISDTVIGLLIAEGIVAEIFLFARGRRLVERLGPAGLTAVAAGASVLRWTVTGLSPGLAVLALVQSLHAATFALQHLSAMQMLSRTIPPERAGAAQALHAALGMGAPTGLMMLVSGWLYARTGGHVFFAMAALSGLALLLMRPLARASR
jgi:PPP family 3-phenylpropionic acid transporter